MIDVMFYEAFAEEEQEIKKILPGDVRAGFTPQTIQEKGDSELPASVISVRTQSRIPLEWAKESKGILTRSQGYDHILAFRRKADGAAQCGFLGNYCARAVAEQAILMMMALLRKLKKQEKNFFAFSRDGLTGYECQGRKVLVVGVGNIGREIVEIARGLKMQVKGVDIVPTLGDLDYVSLPEGIGWAEVVICALSLTEQTEGMLDYHAFGKAKPGLVFVNIARGEISPIEGLKRLLDEEKISGIGLDVYPQEGLLAESLRAKKRAETPQAQLIIELAESEKVIFTPHNAFNTKEALARKAALTVKSVVACLSDGTFPYPLPET